MNEDESDRLQKKAVVVRRKTSPFANAQFISQKYNFATYVLLRDTYAIHI